MNEVETRRGPHGEAVFSSCGRYRYSLTRRWDDTPTLLREEGAPVSYVLWIMLNPSTADETKLDPTLTRCANFSRDWGFDGMVVRNVFAFRTPSPKVMLSALAEGVDIVGPENDKWLSDRNDVGRVIVGWGAEPLANTRAAQIASILGRDLECLGLNQDGSPKHPLYLHTSTQPVPFQLDLAV